MKRTTRRTLVRTCHDGARIMRETELGSDGSNCDNCGKRRIVRGVAQQLFVYFTETEPDVTIVQHNGSFCSDKCHDAKQDDDDDRCAPEPVPVLFRLDGKKSEGGPFLTAVFPTIPASVINAYSMYCYAHIGQHSGCSFAWYLGTREAKPADYAELKAELESIGYTLRVYRRMTKYHRDALAAEVRR